MTALSFIGAVTIGLLVSGVILAVAVATRRYLADRDEVAPVVEPKRGGILDDDVARRQQATYERLIERHYPEAQTAAGRRGDELHRAFAKAAEAGLWADHSARQVRAGAPDAVRELLAGIGDTLLHESAAAAVRGDYRNARHLSMLEEGVRDARDAIVD